MRLQKRNKATSCKQQATGWQAKKATSCKQQATGWQATKKKTKHADNADFIGFSQIRKKICGHLFKSVLSERLFFPSLRGTKQSKNMIHWIASYLAMTNPVNPDSDRKRLKDLQDKMKQINQHLEMSRMGLNMYNPLQAKRSWGYRITPTLSELRSSSICYHGNHLNHINHSSDKKGRMGESTKGRSNEHFLVAFLPVACCLFPYNNVIKSNL